MAQNLSQIAFSTAGQNTLCNLTAPAYISAPRPAYAVLNRIIVVNPGTAGSLTLNDETALGNESAANTIISIPHTSMTAGQSIDVKAAYTYGLAVSSVPTGGQFTITYS